MSFLFVVLVLPLLSCSSAPILMHIGERSISEVDVSYMSRVAACYGDTIVDRERTVATLAASLLESEALRSAFHDVPDRSLLQERAEVISSTTRDSAMLACILNIGDRDRYFYLIVSPTLINPRLHARYASDSLIHAAARDSIQSIYQQLLPRPDLFLGYHLDTLRIERSSSDPFAASVLAHMNLGNLWPNIIETDQDLRIIMLHGTSDSLYQVLALRVEKKPFDQWFRSFVKAHIAITFNDPTLESAIRKRYPTLWWLPTSL